MKPDVAKAMLREIGITCGANCARCAGPCPPELTDGVNYLRQPGEYIRPATTKNLCRSVGRDRLFTMNVSGVNFRQNAIRELPQETTLEAELVPEPGNWYDPQAVAVEIADTKVGYLGRNSAGTWHDIVTAFNGRGFRVVTDATVEPDAEVVDVGLLVTLPSFDGWATLHRTLGFDTEFYALLDALPASVCDDLMGSSWAQFDSPKIVRALFAYRDHMPRLEWERILAGTHRAQLPGRLNTRLRQESKTWRGRRSGRR